MPEDRLELSIGSDVPSRVPGILRVPPRPLACYVLAHGAGAGMTHPFMEAVAEGLHDRQVATLRYEFPYMARGSKRIDSPAVAHATVRAAVAEAAVRLPSAALIAGGKSFGGRMTSQAQAIAPLPGVRGLAFLGFPLHPAKQPSVLRATHLFDVRVPMLFVQGSRDALAENSLLAPLIRDLGGSAALVEVDGADHSFHVAARSGKTDGAVMATALNALASWIEETVR